MRKILIVLAAVAVAVLGGHAADAAPRVATGTIVLNEPGPHAFGDVVTFTTSSQGLKSNQSTLAYLLCRTIPDDGPYDTLYDKFDLPNAAFVLGGPDAWAWLGAPQDATCIGRLYRYTVKGTSSIISWLADTAPFTVSGP